ncbi:MAG: phosphatase PAP2 family protein [Chloroflexota bacterium]|nr:phosphatase PAP2 family protein [Chloroflexota bacterium]
MRTKLLVFPPETLRAAMREGWLDISSSGKYTLSTDRSLLVASVAQGVLFGLLGWWVRLHPVSAIDFTITRTLQKTRSPLVRGATFVLSYTNAHPVMNVLSIPLAAFLWRMHLRLEAATVLVAVAATNLFRQIVQRVVNRPRPSPLFVRVHHKAHRQSFPSGHVLSSVTLWGWLLVLRSLFLKEIPLWQKLLFSIPVLFIATIGPTRIYMGEHWATDVLGGYLLGGSWLSLTFLLYRTLKKRGILASG